MARHLGHGIDETRHTSAISC